MYVKYNNIFKKKKTKTSFTQNNQFFFKKLNYTKTLSNINLTFKQFIVNQIFLNKQREPSIFFNKKNLLPYSYSNILYFRLNKIVYNIKPRHIDTLYSSIFLKKNFIFFKSFIRFILWSLPVPKHKSIYLWIRVLAKTLVKDKLVKNIFMGIKGKLAVTGNKRTRSFLINYGVFNSTDLYHYNSFLVRTQTGLLVFSIKYSFY